MDKILLDLIDTIGAWMQSAVKYGLWDMISAIFIVASSFVGYTVLFWAKRRIPKLNFDIRRQPRDDTNYPLKVCVEIRNYTGSSLVIFADYYVYTGGLRPDPNARGDRPSGKYEIKFPDPASNTLREVEYLLRHRESVSTWVPIDPTHTNEEVDAAIERQNIAKLHFKCIWLHDKPTVDKLLVRM